MCLVVTVIPSHDSQAGNLKSLTWSVVARGPSPWLGVTLAHFRPETISFLATR